jgi:hypothetical protein
MPNEAEAIPDELKAPIGVADDLLLPPRTPVGSDTVSGGVLGKGDNGEEVTGTQASKKEESGEKKGVESQGSGENSPGTVRFFRCLLFFRFLISLFSVEPAEDGSGGWRWASWWPCGF